MASTGHEYSLVGFSDEVDRRPLIFVEALPVTRLCSACGVVPKVIALHQCQHFFCKACYEQCQRSGEVVCPLDGEACLEEEVNWINHSTRSVMAKKVFCWNQSNGCNVVMAAADMSKHFHHECGHHLARCPKCGAGIPASEVCGHLESRCDASRAFSAAAVQPSYAVSEEAVSATCSELCNGFQRIYTAISKDMSSIQAELKQISRVLKIGVTATTCHHGETGEGSLEGGILQESLGQVRIQTAKLKDQLDEFMQNVNANQQTFHNSFVEKNEALKQSLTDAVERRIDQSELAAQFAAFRATTEDRHRETKADLDRLSLAIDGKCDRIIELLGHTNASLERPVRNCAESAEAHAESLAQNASEIAWAKSSRAEDRQNAMALLPSNTPIATTHTWTIEVWESIMKRAERTGLEKRMLEPVYMRGYCVSVGIRLYRRGQLSLLFQLHKGKLDQYLEWPFNLTIKSSILHPQGTEKLERCVTPSTWFFPKSFSRPIEVSNERLLTGPFWTTAQLESRGFLKEGRMLLRLELEPPAEDQP